MDVKTLSLANLEDELAQLVEQYDVDFLLQAISKISPPERFLEIAQYHKRQSEEGGGFFGLLPEQMADEKDLPIPDSDTGILAAAIELARQRSVNLQAISTVNPEYTFSFTGDAIPDWSGDHPPSMSLHLDISVIRDFLEANVEGEVAFEELKNLVNLPANQEMLQHRQALSYMPPPQITKASLTNMILRAASNDPLNRLWNWLNPMNNFGYADLAIKSDDYTFLVDQIEENGQRLARKVLSNVILYTPPETELEETFAFTVGFFIRGWATNAMAGINIEQVKDNWDFILGTVTEEVYHRYQLKYCPTADGQQAQDFEDLASADFGDRRYDKLYELLTYTVLEGAANRARGEYISKQLPDGVSAGIQLVTDFSKKVVQENDLNVAEEMIANGLASNGPLYSLGWHLAGLIEAANGTHAVGAYQQRGPVAFTIHACEIAAEDGEPLFPPEVTDEFHRLETLLAK